MPDRLREIYADSGRIMAVKQITEIAPVNAAILGCCALASAVLPNIVRVSLGVMIGYVPVAAVDGFGSTAGHAVIIALVVTLVSYLGSLLVEPVQLSAAKAAKVRLTYATQARLMKAVSEPTGVGHLENRAVLGHLAGAQGQLMSYFPADAPATLAQVIGIRLGGFIACAVLAWFRPWLGLVLLVVWLFVRRPMRKAVAAQVSAHGGKADVMRRAAYFRDLSTKPQAAKEIRVFGLGDWASDEFRSHWLAGMRETWQVARRLNVTVGKLMWLVAATYALGVGMITYAAYHREIGLGAVAVMLPTLFATAPTGSVSWADVGLEWMVSGLPSLRKLEGLIDGMAEPLAGRRSAPRELTGEIRLDGVYFRYPGAQADVFEGLDLVIPAGKATAFVGANGTGKTTLIKLVSRLLEPTSGRILVDGIDLREMDAREWQRRVGAVFQDFTRFPFSAAENIGVGAVEHLTDHDGVLAAARRAGAEAIVEELPDGWATVLAPQYTGGVDLSGGQWQRIALARALFAVRHGARLLILDEPTAWLDVEAEADFFNRFLEITGDLTTIIVSHRFSTVRKADHICVLDGGQLIEEGDHDILYALGGRYAEMFDMQAARFAEPTEVPDVGGAR